MTERFVAEKKARRSLFGMFKSPFSHHPCVRAVMDTTANTNVVLHAGKLLALCEHGPAYELDPSEFPAYAPWSLVLINLTPRHPPDSRA